jgi:hypothetical protein
MPTVTLTMPNRLKGIKYVKSCHNSHIFGVLRWGSSPMLRRVYICMVLGSL